MKNAPIQHRVELSIFLLVSGLLRLLPHSAARRFGHLLGDFFFRLGRRRRRIAIQNLADAFPQWPSAQHRRVARDSSRQLGASFCDALSARRFSLRQLCARVRLEGFEHLTEAASRDTGYLVTTPHFGHWEISAWIIGGYCPPFNIVGRPLDNPHLDRLLTQMRTRFGSAMIPKRGAVRGMLKALKAGQGVGLLIDQRMQKHEGIMVPFFGRPASTSPMLARMSIKSGAAVIPFYCYPEPKGRYRMVFKPAIEPGESGEKVGKDKKAEALTRLYLENAEEAISEHPHLWLWAHNRWKE